MVYEVAAVEEIRGNEIYPAVTVKLIARFNHSNEYIPFHLDIAVGDVITPEPVLKRIDLFVDETKGKSESIELWTYPIPTILAEKLETILRRGTLNTRSKDFYDMYLLLTQDDLNILECLEAFRDIVAFRITDVDFFDYEEYLLTLSEINEDAKMQQQWLNYINGDAVYAAQIVFSDIIQLIKAYIDRLNEAYLFTKMN